MHLKSSLIIIITADAVINVMLIIITIISIT